MKASTQKPQNNRTASCKRITIINESNTSLRLSDLMRVLRTCRETLRIALLTGWSKLRTVMLSISPCVSLGFVNHCSPGRHVASYACRTRGEIRVLHHCCSDTATQRHLISGQSFGVVEVTMLATVERGSESHVRYSAVTTPPPRAQTTRKPDVIRFSAAQPFLAIFWCLRDREPLTHEGG